tara:strand:- start:817 stop:1077 length:261 start_codon:yes stop_codon:yes gene_type:complete
MLSTMDIPFSVFVSTKCIGNNFIFTTTIIRMILYGTELREIDLPSQNKKYKIRDFYDKDILHKILSIISKILILKNLINHLLILEI